MLEALLRRVDGLEQRLRDEKKNNARQSPLSDGAPGMGIEEEISGHGIPQRPPLGTINLGSGKEESVVCSPTPTRYAHKLRPRDQNSDMLNDR